MQTAKIKPQETYAMWRSGALVRFYVAAIVTRKETRKTVNTIEGYVLEDTTPDGQRGAMVQVGPDDLVGPYEEQAELVARKAQENAAREAKEAEANHLALVDRLALYAFVGQHPPEDVDQYDQPFRVRWGNLNVDNDGVKLIVAKVHALLGTTTTTTEHSPELIAAAVSQWKREGKM